jgi:hypothetical protein
MNTMQIDYDCGYTITTPLVLRDDQTLLHNAALGDQIILLADAQHDTNCEVCR